MPTPEARREERRKFDRHDAYVWFHIGVWLVALGILLTGGPPTGAVAALPWGTQQMLGGCMLAGSGSAIIGMLMGSPVLRRDTVRRPLDLRYPYAFGLAGLMGVGVSMWAYFMVIAANSSLVGTLGGGLTLTFGCMAFTLGWRFAKQIVARTRLRTQLTNEAIRERDGQ